MAAPKGNRNARKGKDWEAALRQALGMYEDREKGITAGQALRKIADNVVKLALEGSKDAIAEIANRLDGKATEHVVGEFHHHHTADLTDDELAAIATGSSDGTPEETPRETDASGIH